MFKLLKVILESFFFNCTRGGALLPVPRCFVQTWLGGVCSAPNLVMSPSTSFSTFTAKCQLSLGIVTELPTELRTLLRVVTACST